MDAQEQFIIKIKGDYNMKILKENCVKTSEDEGMIEDKKLTEAEDVSEIDPSESQQEIASDLQDNIEAASGGETVISQKGSEDVANELKQDSKELNAPKVAVIPTKAAPLKMKNRLTDVLDDALEAALYFRQENISEVANVLVCGLPGSSKTASIYNWAEGKVNITYVDAKNTDLGAFINGYTVQDPNDPLTTTQAVSKNLNGLDRPRSVLFLDEYNRQTKPGIRASILTLINEHYIQGREEGGRHYFDNFLFTIAAINPGGTANDEGAAVLNDAEKSRFLYSVNDFDSDPGVTSSYLDQQYMRLAQRLAAMKDVDAEDVWDKTRKPAELDPKFDKKMDKWDRIEALLRIRDLGKFIVDHIDFEYDNKNDLDNLWITGKKMLNQRSLTSGVSASKGDVEKFKRWVDGASNFLPKDIQMLDAILNTYTVPTREEILQAAGLTEPKAPSTEEEQVEEPATQEAPAEETASEEPETEAEEEEIEDDDDFFTGAKKAANGQTILTRDEAKQRVLDQINNW